MKIPLVFLLLVALLALPVAKPQTNEAMEKRDAFNDSPPRDRSLNLL
jgi:hypothetical protein